ncbi:TetR/AcrR family transcriptional regulator [Clostridium massiliamazoniense]|uniref:TetR/AcrR family transcriptional regulator n=1 Tax=Clostridium massiliamazoniense TaxID=1347366 RepID=UPI0006D7FFE3|nr:TetR/AcrR family transcriptional regulator [Clostridium massiliamazoniense]
MSRKEQAQLTKAKIFKTAIELINQKGFDNVTVSEICKEAGVAKGTFYVHFESKEDIIKENYHADMSNYVLKNFDNFILNEYKTFAQKNPDKSIKEKIVQFLKYEFMYANHIGYDLICRVYLTNLSDSINGKNHHFVNREFLPTLKELICEGIEHDTFTKYNDLDTLVLYIESFARGIMTTWCLAKGNFDIVEIGETHIRTLIENL